MTEIVPLTPEHWAPLAVFFSERGDPRWCWCMFWRRSAKDSRKATVAQQRAGLKALVDGERPPGLVALRDGRAVGWVSLAPREDFERIERSRVIPRIDDAPVWSIVCFAVSAAARGTGLTSELLDAAIAWARTMGATELEAYPVDVDEADRVDPNALYTGTLATFERAGFRVASETSSSAGGRPRRLVRLVL